MRSVVALAGLAALATVVAAEPGQYQLSARPDGGAFVLDTASGRVWRYDRTDDAWYLYDLEALAGHGGRKVTRSTPTLAPPVGTPADGAPADAPRHVEEAPAGDSRSR